MAQYPKIESIGSTGSFILAILEVQVHRLRQKKPNWVRWADRPSGGSPQWCQDSGNSLGP